LLPWYAPPAAERFLQEVFVHRPEGAAGGMVWSRVGSLREIHIIPDVGQRQWRGSRMAPRCLVMAPTVDEQIQVQLPLHGPVLAT
jgi:hypothetical protein